MQHDHHDVTVSTLHAHLDHENCIETVILRGPTEAVMHFAESVIAQERCPPRKVSSDPDRGRDARFEAPSSRARAALDLICATFARA
jgi:NikR C terminal nickel binding domain